MGWYGGEESKVDNAGNRVTATTIQRMRDRSGLRAAQLQRRTHPSFLAWLLYAIVQALVEMAVTLVCGGVASRRLPDWTEDDKCERRRRSTRGEKQPRRRDVSTRRGQRVRGSRKVASASRAVGGPICSRSTGASGHLSPARPCAERASRVERPTHFHPISTIHSQDNCRRSHLVQ